MSVDQQEALRQSLAKAKANPAKQSKAERKAETVSKAMAKDNLKVVPKSVQPPVQDQKDTSQDQKSGTPDVKVKKTKKLSATHVAWRDLDKDFPKGDMKIKVLVTDKNPKSRGAATRFKIYTDGMTVDQYIEASQKAGNAKGLAREDIRWDFVKKFIDVR